MDWTLIQNALKSNNQKVRSLAADYLALERPKAAKQNFKFFVQMFWPQVATNPLVDGWYLDAICDHLANITTIKRLVINIPPRHGKSTIVGVLFPAWFWLTHPNTKFLCSSYSLEQLSIRDSIACRSVIESPLYQAAWSKNFTLSQDQNTKHRFTNDRLGFRLATSTASAIVGEGCDILIADDLNDVNKANSQAERTSVINWWTQVMSTRMNPGGLDCKVVIQQRCHEEDITGFILKNGGTDWTHLILPWHFDPPRKAKTLIWTDPRTQPDEPLSSLFTEEKVKELKGATGLGPTGFNCQFNQQPAPAQGNIFKKDYFGTYQETPDEYVLGSTKVRKDKCNVFVVTDLAISLKETADWTVGQVWAITPQNHLLLVEEWRERVEGPDAVKGFKRLQERYKPDFFYVEDVAFQRLMIQLLRQHGLPVRALKTMGQDKKARCQRSLIKAECGQVWLPDKSWVPEWLAEVCAFPNARHDDRVDCLSWAGIVSQKYGTQKVSEPESPVDRLAQAEAAAMWN